MVFRFLAVIALTAALLSAARIRLYLKDGSHHVVREYEKQGDRVRFFSTERDDWEEIPANLVDLKRTENEIVSTEAARKEDAAAQDAEEKAERQRLAEIQRIPMNPGVYMVIGEELVTLTQAEAKSVNNKRRSILKAVTPIPILSGKSTIELDGLKSARVLTQPRPEFYFRLATEERMAIHRMQSTKTSRIVQTLNKIPVSNEIIEEADVIETFKQQLGDGLYKIWPTKPLEPGEYAVVEFTQGEGNIQAWDFAIAPAK
jgi:hypothetical protein